MPHPSSKSPAIHTEKLMSSSPFAKLPAPPYYSVIFPSQRTDGNHGYDQMSERMVELAAAQPGFLGVESVRGSDGFGITVSYWESLAAIAAWKANADHQLAQETGRQQWYEHYEVRIARVERAYSFATAGQVDSEAEVPADSHAAGQVTDPASKN